MLKTAISCPAPCSALLHCSSYSVDLLLLRHACRLVVVSVQHLVIAICQPSPSVLAAQVRIVACQGVAPLSIATHICLHSCSIYGICLRRSMSITQFMVPKVGKGAAGSKRQLTVGDVAQPEFPPAKASRQGRTWIDWQLSECNESPCSGPQSLASLGQASPARGCAAHLGKPARPPAVSLLRELLTEDSWRALVDAESKKPYFAQLESFLKQQLESKTVYPPRQQIFRALNELPVSKVKAVIIGQVRYVTLLSQKRAGHEALSLRAHQLEGETCVQDPYHGPGQAEGLCFSVPKGQKVCTRCCLLAI